MLNFIIPLTKIPDGITEMVVVLYNVLLRYDPRFVAKHSKTQMAEYQGGIRTRLEESDLESNEKSL